MAKSSALARVIGFTRSFSTGPDVLHASGMAVEDGLMDGPVEQHSVAVALTTEIELAPEMRLLFPRISDTAPPGSDAAPSGAVEALDTMEAGIASLLAIAERRETIPGESLLHGNLDGSDEDGPIMALLDELDRLWRADPEITPARLH